VIDLDYPAMRRFFRPERINDRDALLRIACLEYLAGQMGSRLAN
jgi:asparagine synthase (glutamine-hydrolysing)